MTISGILLLLLLLLLATTTSPLYTVAATSNTNPASKHP
jgi:hypothetical protein